MPTHEETSAFWRDWRRLTPQQQTRFREALRRFIEDLWAMEAGEQPWFRRGLRVKTVRGAPGLYEMSWAPDGRAMFSLESPEVGRLMHIVWHRCGDHSVLP